MHNYLAKPPNNAQLSRLSPIIDTFSDGKSLGTYTILLDLNVTHHFGKGFAIVVANDNSL